MNFEAIAKVTEALKELDPKTYVLNIEMADGEKIALSKEEKKKENNLIGFNQ